MSTFVPANGGFRSPDAAFVGLAWALATAVNVGKAVHVDDAAHLAIAEHILADPLHPMRGMVFWGTHPEPIHALNQPHLFFYVLAGALAISGGSIVVAHLALAATVLPGMIAFHATAQHLLRSQTEARVATALVFLGPGFLPGQNLMCDAPLVSLICVALWALITAEGERARSRLIIAGVALGLACLVKYTAIALLPLFLIDARRDRSRAFPIAIALAFLGAYAAFNLYDYGGVHVLERHPGGVGDFGVLERVGVTFARAALFVLTLGAIAFAPWIVALSRRERIALASSFVVLVIATRIVAAIGPMEMRDEPWAVTLLRTAFFLSGVLAIVRLSRSVDLADRIDVLLASAVVLVSVFVVVLSPFVAVRHALLVLPPLTLLVLRHAAISETRAISVAIVAAILGLTVATADRVQAGVYREAGQRYRERSATSGHGWFVGHWGWQWYASRAGLDAYDPGVSVLRPGDVVIRPAWVDAQPFDSRDEACLVVDEETEVPAGATAIARTITSRSGYYAVWQGLPYGPSDEPLARFTTYRVTCFALDGASVQSSSR